MASTHPTGHFVPSMNVVRRRCSQNLTLVGLNVSAPLVSAVLRIIPKKALVGTHYKTSSIISGNRGESNDFGSERKRKTILCVPAELGPDFNSLTSGEGVSPNELRSRLPFDIQEQFKELELTREDSFRMSLYPFSLEYNHMSYGVEVPFSFETVGHIGELLRTVVVPEGFVAHFNLRDDQLPFKNLIGQILCDKNAPRIKTVVNKVGVIENQFRVLPLEVIAGLDDCRVQIKESGCIFRFDYRRVYWNSRLDTEHRRLISLFKKGDIVWIGPFAIPSAKKGVILYANDLNPDSAQYLEENRVLNKIPSEMCNITCEDARTRFLALTRAGVWPDHIIMNLPASSVSFIDMFRELPADEHGERNRGPAAVHCYAFSDPTADDAVQELCSRISRALGWSCERLLGSVPSGGGEISFHSVRNVAPRKDMYCASFHISRNADNTEWIHGKRKRAIEEEV